MTLDKIPSIPLRFCLKLPLVWLGAGLYCMAGGLTLGWNLSSVENGFIEIMQLVALFFAVAIFLAAAYRAHGPLRVICLSAVWLLAMVWFREYEAEEGDGALSHYLGSRLIMRQWTMVLFAVMGIWLARGGWRTLPSLAHYGFSTRIWPFFAASLLLPIGEFFESRHFQWAEETCELLSYCSFVSAGCWYYKAAVANAQPIPL